jgi:opacity protein-like surface antigen
MRTTVRVLAPLALLLYPALLSAQLAGLDVHASLAHASAPLFQVADGTGFGDGGGLGLGAALAVRVHANVEIAAGYTSQTFDCAARCTLRGSGLDVGLRGVLPLMNRLELWGGGGILQHRLELRDQPPSQQDLWWSIHRTDSGRYFEGGASFRLLSNLMVQSGVRTNGYGIRTRPLDEDGVPGDEETHDIRYTTVRVGLRLIP